MSEISIYFLSQSEKKRRRADACQKLWNKYLTNAISQNVQFAKYNNMKTIEFTVDNSIQFPFFSVHNGVCILDNLQSHIDHITTDRVTATVVPPNEEFSDWRIRLLKRRAVS